MYILIVARGYPTERYKMNGIFEFDQAKALVNSGHKVVYAALDMRSIRRKRRFGFESLYKEGVPIEVLNVPVGNVSTRLFHSVGKLSLKILFRKIVQIYGKPKIIHTHFISNGYMASDVLADKGIPIIHTEHYSALNNDTISSTFIEMGNHTYNTVDKVITVSESLKGNIEKSFGIESVVIPNIVDTKTFTYGSKMNNDKNTVFRFISTGNLTINKRMDLLIKAFTNAFEEINNIELLIFGDGSERGNLETLIKKNNMEEKIKLMGLVDREEIAKYMQISDCFILLSKLETFGVAFIEAMASGLPVISTKSGGPEDFINNSNGVILLNDDISSVSMALKEMKLNAGLYNKTEISSSCTMLFSPERVSMQLVELYNSLVVE